MGLVMRAMGLRTTAISVFLAGIAAPAVAVTPVEGLLQVRSTAFTQGKQNPATLSTVLGRETWSATTPTVIVVSGGTARVGTQSSPKAQAEALQHAFWEADGLSGNVSFDYSWRFGFNAGDGVTGAEFTGNTPDWNYTFDADRGGVFSLGYIVNANGNPFGLGGWNLVHNGVVVLPLQNVLDPRARGAFDFAYDGGQRHSFSLVNNANIVPGLGNASLQGGMTATFRYFITESAVPEPGSWAMMILGIGLVGATLRRRRGATSRRLGSTIM
jgi:hypothetical protein